MIVSDAISKHQHLVKQLRGLPGLRLDRWHEAFTVRHCALSLVGEPIMYPHISALVRLLHERRISTFLVTNAQFPEAISNLGPVTQLYVSIDAATKDTLRAIDRPLFADFYERFLGSLDALRTKRQRTVYRMTLVKGGNMCVTVLCVYHLHLRHVYLHLLRPQG
jgi:tRNA wybutosine-synthesizing protein 1